MGSTISHREMRNSSAEVLRRVESGEELIVTNHGRPVARLSPLRPSALGELGASGRIRQASLTWATPPEDARIKLPDGATTADIIADVRGYDRDY